MTLPVLIIDGYNIIGAWQDLQEMKNRDLGSARDQLISIMAGYRDWAWSRIIIVFDGQNNKYQWEEVEGIEVVFTGSRESADTMIERLAAGLNINHRVEVATSDFAEFRAVSNLGARVYSASSLKEKLAEQQESIRRRSGSRKKEGLMLNDVLNQAARESLNKLRHPGKP